jgi:serine/threonine-protein kinase
MTDLDRLTATLTGRYEIEQELGQGGMATVYLAQDVRHDRKVALKVLRPELAAVIGAERFLAEIKTTANLQHPNILALYDSGEADSFLFYVMPYIEGESLRDRIDREKQLPVNEAVALAAEIAGALDYAHRQDVIHRDIKPENILLHDGRAMVADFGIALAVSTAGSSRMTETGMSLGTPHYMSPEQAMGERELDARSDVYALGCVLYEMLTGEPPFTGTTAQAIVARVVTESPRPLIPQRHTIPPHVEASVLKAIEKLPADRFASGAAFAHALTSAAAAPLPAAALSGPAPSTIRSPLTLGLAALSVVLAGLLIWSLTTSSSPAAEVIRVSVKAESASGNTFLRTSMGPSMTLAPDGRSMVRTGPTASTGTGGSQLWLRRWNSLQEEPLRGTVGGVSPVYSPDGRSVAYIDALNRITVLSLASGTQEMVLESGLQDVSIRGGGIAWGPDGMLYGAGLHGLIRIPLDGGRPEQLTVVDSANGEMTHGWVDVLPSGRGALISIIPREIADLDQHVVAAVDFENGTVSQIFQGVFARYVHPGYVVLVQGDGAMYAAPFNGETMALTGDPVLLPDSIQVGSLGAAQLAVSPSGMMVYASSRNLNDVVVWVTRDGTEEPMPWDWSGELINPALSPDGRRITMSERSEEGYQAWARDLAGGQPIRLSFNGYDNTRMAWTPDGSHIAFISSQLGPTAAFIVRSDGSEGEVLLPTGDPRPVFGLAWSPDGRWLVFRTDNQAEGLGDILAIRPGIDSVARVLVATPAEELSPSVSPDGRWLAYVSSVSGSHEVYVRPFLADGPAQRVSLQGGTEPLWSRDGRELFYLSASDSLMTIEVTPGPQMRLGRRRALFSTAEYHEHLFHRNYDVALDGQRFIMLRDAEGEDNLVVVFNWAQELKQLFDN